MYFNFKIKELGYEDHNGSMVDLVVESEME
jgi:hypothetical protein